MKKKMVLIFFILFTVLTFAGVIYVLRNHGTVSAGYAVVPSIWSLICGMWYRKLP